MESNHQLSPFLATFASTIVAVLAFAFAIVNGRKKRANNADVRNGQGFSLRSKLLFFATILVLVPGGVYGAITFVSSRAALARVIGRQLVEEASNGADRLATTLHSERARLESLARQDVMREIRIADFDKRISSLLVSVKRGCPSCLDLLVLDLNNQVVASSNPAWIGKTTEVIPGGADLKEAMKGPFRVASSSQPLLRFNIPVSDPDASQALLGHLIALYDWTQGTNIIARVRENLRSVGLNVDVLVLDARGVVIGGATRAQSLWPLGAQVRLQQLENEDQTARGYIDSSTDMLVGYARLPEGLPPWTVVVAEPLSNAFAPVRRMVTSLVLALASTLFVALAVALFVARRVTRSLTELTTAAKVVGSGARLAAAVPVRSRDEIGALTTAFNRMAADLKRAEQELVEAAKFSFVGELAAGVAHEVRTPLGVLRSSAQLLGRSLEVKDDEARELLDLLQGEVDRIEQVVSALLDLGRPREMRPEPSPLGQILFRAADFVDVQARQKHIAIRRHAVDPDPVLFCDSELIYQVALNLLVNAVQILPDGGSIELNLSPPRDGFAGFTVRDDGPGMNREVCTHIFEPFFTRREGGAGLGLTFVQRVVQEHHGQVSVESEIGRGTAFHVTLPLAEGFK